MFVAGGAAVAATKVDEVAKLADHLARRGNLEGAAVSVFRQGAGLLAASK